MSHPAPALTPATARPPADRPAYFAGWLIVLAPILGAWDVLAEQPMWLGVTLLLALLGVPVSLRLRQLPGVDSRRLNLLVTLLALVALFILLQLSSQHGEFSRRRLLDGEAVPFGWAFRIITFIVACRSFTLLSDYDLQLAIGFGLSQFILLGLLGDDRLIILGVLLFIGAALFMRLRLHRRERLRGANQVLGRLEPEAWQQDAGLLARLSVIIGLLAVVLGLGLSGLDLRDRLFQAQAQPSVRFMQWLADVTGTRLPEGSEAAMEVADVGGSTSEVALFRVTGPTPRLWRGSVFGRYDGRRFTHTMQRQTRRVQITEPDQIVPIRVGQPLDPGDLERFDFTPLLGLGVQIYGVGDARLVRAEVDWPKVMRGESLATMPQLAAGQTYSVWAPRYSPEPPTDLVPLTAADREYYLRLPEVVGDRVRDFTAELTADAVGPEAQLEAIMRWLGEHKLYTLRPEGTPWRREAVEYFLFEMDAGWCRHFAAALAIMARTLGIPSRVVSGYATGEDLPDGGWLVRMKDAHAWVECWLPGRGWVEFDPTDRAVEQLTGLARVYDQLRAGGRHIVATVGWPLLLGGPLLLVAVVLVWRFWPQIRAWRLARRRRRRRGAGGRVSGGDPRAERLTARLRGLARAWGLSPRPAETERVLAARLAAARPTAAEAAATLGELLSRGRFGPRLLTDDEWRTARACLAMLARAPRPPR